MKNEVAFWFRRDLRLEDNKGLYYALQEASPLRCFFVFDKNILDLLEDKSDARVTFIHQQLTAINSQLASYSSNLEVFFGEPEEAWKYWFEKFPIRTLVFNEDFEPYALQRDKNIESLAIKSGIAIKKHLDHLLFHPSEITKDDGKPYTVFTPYSKKWKKRWAEINSRDQPTLIYPSEIYTHYALEENKEIISLESMGFIASSLSFPSAVVPQSIIKNYQTQRDYPGLNGTSKLGIHFRFGTISTRDKTRKASSLSETFLNELIWREFYMQILYHFPRVIHESFKPKYDSIEWRNNPSEFEAWCQGQTGYPLVDAGMRELNTTGFMHNRVRMLTASFLTKHLLIDWRWGEAYFAQKLLDFELASNNGGWQWAAGSGTDAAPYFRIFNPDIQLKKFDKDLHYVKKYVPEYGSKNYPSPIVDHTFARERCLLTYQKALKE